MMKVCIVGCGKMADQHALQIRRIPGADLRGVCDREPLMARQMAERFLVPAYFTDVAEMLHAVRPDIVHITTPPATHARLGRTCLLAGCHVYMEKPFTLDTAEAEELIDLAERKGLRITAGHNAQFTPVMVRMRELVRKGYLGGPPVHLESHYCYEFGDAGYAKAMLNDGGHWVRSLPGSLLQNIISHGISKIAEFLAGDTPIVSAHGFTSPFLRDIDELSVVDEVRVLVRDEASTTAYFTFSSQIRPVPHQFRIFGPRRSLLVDDDHQVLIRMDDREHRSYLRYFVPPLELAGQYVANAGGNMRKFLGRQFRLPNDQALHTLIQAFYDSIGTNGPPPIPYREILLTSRIMDEIFAQVRVPQPRGRAVPAATMNRQEMPDRVG